MSVGRAPAKGAGVTPARIASKTARPPRRNIVQAKQTQRKHYSNGATKNETQKRSGSVRSRRRRSRRKSFCITVTRLPWNASNWASSKYCTRYASDAARNTSQNSQKQTKRFSAPSLSAKSEESCHRCSYPRSRAISRTTLEDNREHMID